MWAVFRLRRILHRSSSNNYVTDVMKKLKVHQRTTLSNMSELYVKVLFLIKHFLFGSLA